MARAEAIIDLGALDYNIKRLLSNTKAEGLAVVKADAYGHGLVPVAERALKAGAKWLGTALLEEAIALEMLEYLHQSSPGSLRLPMILRAPLGRRLILRFHH